MCLAIPSKVIKICDDNKVIVDTFGVQREASLDLIEDELNLGDWVLLHIGYVMSKIDETQAKESLALYEKIIDAINEEDNALLEANKDL